MRKSIIKSGGVSFECTVLSPETGGAGVVIFPAEKMEGEVVIPSHVEMEGTRYPVTRIGYHAFAGMGIKSIVVPDTVERIEDSAFENCMGLVDVSLGNGLRRIGASAFAYCKWIRRFDLPETVTQVGCNALEGTRIVDLQRGAVYLGHVLYGYNGTLPEHACIEVREGTTVIADSAFNCRFYLKDFRNLESIVLPEGMKRIGDTAFLECRGLTHVNLPSSLEYIGTSAFGSTGVREVTVPWRDPVRLPTNPFDAHTVIRVPKGTAEAYREAKDWGDSYRQYEFVEE